MDSMKIVWSPFNASNTLRWVSDRHYCPCYTPHGGPGRTWGPDFLFQLSNVMSDFQLKKICHGGLMNDALKEDNSADRHTDADIVLGLRPNPDRLKLRLEAR